MVLAYWVAAEVLAAEVCVFSAQLIFKISKIIIELG
jgi:hypothetical protein